MATFGLTPAAADGVALDDPELMHAMEEYVLVRRLERQEELRLLLARGAAGGA
jgi:hypothetical protein